MKKLVKVVSIVAALSLAVAMLTGCKASFSSSENDVTRNGITRTEKVVTENGKTTTTTVTYTDANGKEMTAEAGEAAFNAAAAEEKGTGAAAAAEDNRINATFHLNNMSGRAIKGIYIVGENKDDWGNNLLSEGEQLAHDNTMTWDTFRYTPNASWKIGVEFADGAEGKITAFHDIHFDDCAHPEDLYYTLVPNEAGNGYTMNMA